MSIIIKYRGRVHPSYNNSFLPSVVREFNSLPVDIQRADSVASFKSMLSSKSTIVPKHFLFGERKSQLLLTRLRTKCSSLSHDLFCKNIIDDPNCTCGQIETTYHYFFHCHRYNGIRHHLFNAVSIHCPVSLDVLLKGNSSLSLEVNKSIFSAVFLYIEKSQRF